MKVVFPAKGFPAAGPKHHGAGMSLSAACPNTTDTAVPPKRAAEQMVSTEEQKHLPHEVRAKTIHLASQNHSTTNQRAAGRKSSPRQERRESLLASSTQRLTPHQRQKHPPKYHVERKSSGTRTQMHPHLPNPPVQRCLSHDSRVAGYTFASSAQVIRHGRCDIALRLCSFHQAPTAHFEGRVRGASPASRPHPPPAARRRGSASANTAR